MVRNTNIRNLAILTVLFCLFAFSSTVMAADYTVSSVSSDPSVVFHEKDPAPETKIDFSLWYDSSKPQCNLSEVSVQFTLLKELGQFDKVISSETGTIPMKKFIHYAGDMYTYSGSYSFDLFDGNGHFTIEDGEYYFQVTVDPVGQNSNYGDCQEDDEANNTATSSLIDFTIKETDFTVDSIVATGPYAHVKNSLEPEITLEFNISYIDPDFSFILCGNYDIPVRIELYRSGEIDPVSTQDTLGTNCSNTFHFPLYDESGNLKLPHDTYYFRIILDPDDTILEMDETNNILSSSGFEYAIASGDLYYGNDITAAIDPGTSISRSGPDFTLTGTGSWTNSWGTYALSFSGTMASKRGTNTDGYSIDLDALDSLDVGTGTLNGNADGLEVQLENVTLDPESVSNPGGMNYSTGTVNLPENVTIHRDRTTDNRIDPHGISYISFSGGEPVNDPNKISLDTVGLSYPVYLHSYGLPFYIKTFKVSLSLLGSGQVLALDPGSAKPVYVHKTTLLSLAPDDDRKITGFRSNDVLFIKGIGSASTPYINGGGLHAGLQFDTPAACDTSYPGTLPKTLFPAGRLCWKNKFTVEIQKGHLQPFQLDAITFSLGFTGECPGGNCGDSLGINRYEMIPSTGFGFQPDGAFGGTVDDVMYPTLWGQLDSTGLYTYEKDDTEKTGALYVPGFIATGTEASTSSGAKYSVAQYLLGSRAFKSPDTPGPVHYLNDPSDPAAENGNEYFAGINLGPQYLESASGVDPGETSLINTADLKILFNGNSAQNNFSVTEYTKYVMRPGGITGVFNTDFSGLIDIYSYELKLKRFAFRQVMNRMDDETFIDGSLDLPFPADLHVAFSNLNITCTGDFSEGEVETEPCDGFDNDNDGMTDEGCGQALSYWNVPITYLGMEFRDQGSPGVCPNPDNRKLYLNTRNQVNGISEKITLGAFWNPDGTPEDEVMTAMAQMWMDPPPGDETPGSGTEEEGTGFAVVLAKGYLNHNTSYPSGVSDGFTNLVSRVDVPLFFDIPIHGHFKNESVDPEDTGFDLFLFKDESESDGDRDGVPSGYDASITEYRDLLSEEDESLSQDPRPRAQYTWPSSEIITLDYPLLYTRAHGSTTPRFKGVKQDTSLPEGDDPVLSVYSVPDFIEPDHTKLSFGISADVAAIADASLDELLSDTLGIDDISVEGMLDGLFDATGLMQNVTGGNITDLFEPVLDGALDPLADEGAPLDLLADLISRIHNTPSLVESQICSLVTSALDRVEDRITAGVDDSLNRLYTSDMAALMAYSETSIDQALDSGNLTPPSGNLYEMRNSFEELKNSIATVRQTLEQTAEGVSQAKSAVETLQQNTVGSGGVISRVSGAITDIKSAIGTLNSYTSSDPSENPLFEPIETAQGYIENAKTEIADLDIGTIANTLEQAASLSGGSIDTSFISDAEQFIDERTEELDDLLTEAESNFQDLFSNVDTGQLFDDAENRLDDIEGHVNSLETMLKDLFSRVLEDMDNDGTNDGGYIGFLEGNLNAIADAVETLEDSFTNLPGGYISSGTTWGNLKTEGRQALDTLSQGIINSLTALEGEAGATAGAIDTSAGAYISLFAENLITLIDAPLQTGLGELGTLLDEAWDEVTGGFIPDPDAEGIKELLISVIMNSEPVQEINNSFFQVFGVLSDYIDDLTGELTSQINRLISEALSAVSETLNSQIENVTSQIGGSGGDLAAASIDGYAIVSQEEVERFHLEAEFEFSGDPDPTIYWAALDITSWNAENGKASACSMDGEGLIDVAISTRDISADMLGCSIGIKEALLGFTLNGPVPIGLFGYVYTSGELDFEALILTDMGLEAGVGAIENYLGAKATGRFESYTIAAAFYFGKSCDYTVLKRLDPEVAEFLGDRDGLTGVYVRGSAEVPIWNYSCMLQLGVGCDIGAWYFADPPPTFGGLLGGSAYGRVACIAALKGKITLMGAKTGEQYNFSGSGWGAGGLGACEPADWSSISKSRSDSWCLTGDASFNATYTESWSIEGPDINCCF